MNGFPDELNESRRPDEQKPAQQKRSAGLLLSGILVAISLIAFVLPLAAYHVAQVASALRVRSGLLLLVGVAALLYFLGFVTRLPVFVMAGTIGLCATPFLAAALLMRVKKMSSWLALGVLALPILIVFYSLLSVPQNLDLEIVISANLEKIAASGSQGEQADLLERLRQSGALKDAQEFLNLKHWQRLAALVFADAGSLALSMFGSLVGTVVLIDFAFNQAERMRGVMEYILARKESFPPQLVQLMEQTRESMGSLSRSGRMAKAEQRSLQILSHRKRSQVQTEAGAAGGLASKFVRPPTPPGHSDVFGYRFTFVSELGWSLRWFSVPLWAGLPAIAALTYLAVISGGQTNMTSWLPAEPEGPALVWASLVAVFVLVGLALQGALIVHARLRPFAALGFVLIVLILSGASRSGPLLLAVVLAALGLLDNLYDFRKRLAKNENAV
jgi:hypothetical protein